MSTRTFIDLDCENKKEAIQKLQKLAYAMPQVCIYDITFTPEPDSSTGVYVHMHPPPSGVSEWELFRQLGIDNPDPQRCKEIFSKSGEELGEHDFMFEWKEAPNDKQVKKLENDIKLVLQNINCKVKISTE